MLRRAVVFRHNRRDIAMNAHNFAFDTSTKLYRESVPDGKGGDGQPLTSSRSVSLESSAATGAGGSGVVKKRLSGLQLEALGLYRSCLKAANRLEDISSRRNLKKFIRSEFDKNKSIPRRMVTKIEWQMHYGRTKLEDLVALKPNSKFNIVI